MGRARKCAYAGETCEETYEAINLTDGFSQTFEGTTAGYQNDYVDAVSGSGTGNDVVFEFTVQQDLEATFSLWRRILGHLSNHARWEDRFTQVASDDDGCETGLQSEILWTLNPGTYFLVVDAYSSGQGSYTLTVTANAPTSTNGVYRECITDFNKTVTNELVGSEITPLSEYNSGMEQTLDFNFHVESTDLEA